MELLDFETLAKAAYHRFPLEFTSVIEVCTYCSLESLYTDWKAGAITQKNAEERKRDILRTYEGDCAIYAAYQEGARREHAASLMVKEIETCGCDVCCRLMRLMDGRERVKEEQSDD